MNGTYAVHYLSECC